MSSFVLHLLAMGLMLCDHLWATVIPGNMWLTNLGRIAFPLFAFLLVEGYFHTGNLRKYLLRLLLAALLSELPFNLMYGGSLFYPYHQNVIWTLLLSLVCIVGTERLRAWRKIPGLLLGLLLFLFATVLAFVCMLDYYGFGVLTVGLFYFLRGRDWWKRILQILGLYFIHGKLLGGMSLDLQVFGYSFEIVQQGLAVFAMVPILFYNQKQGPHNKLIQVSFYLFYPVHMLILSSLSLYII